MARTSVALTTPIGSYPALPLAANAADAVQVASDVANGNQIPFGSAARLLVLVINTHASTAYAFTLTSAPDGFNRSGDITAYAIEAADVVPLILNRDGWRQADGNLYISATNAAVKFVAIQL